MNNTAPAPALTTKESALLAAIAEGMDQPGCGWLHELAPLSRSTNAVLGSLIKKGLAHSHKDTEGVPGVASYWVELTPAGEALALPPAAPAAPAPVDLPLIREQLQEDLLILLDGQPQALQDHACQIVVDNLRGLVLPGEALPPAAPAPLSPAPVLPLVNYSQQQQQQQQAPAQLVAPGPLARTVAPLGLPIDSARCLEAFGLALDGLLTTSASNPKVGKGAAQAWGVILHHLPARSLAAAINGPASATTAPRSKLPGLALLASFAGIRALVEAHNGCPWASKGCADGCLAWAGHGGISAVVASCRARRTMAWVYDPQAYAKAILWALGRAYRQAQTRGLPLAYRLKGTDDLPWHWIRFDISPAEAAIFARRFGLPLCPGQGVTIPEALQLAAPGTLKPYEYSKAPVNGPLGLRAQRAAGIDITASLAADRPGGLASAIDAIGAGFRLAVPVALAKGQPLPPALILNDGLRLRHLITVDGDLSDNRYLDPQGPQPCGAHGVAVILKTKSSKGRGAASVAFSLQPLVDQPQALAGGGTAHLRSKALGQP